MSAAAPSGQQHPFPTSGAQQRLINSARGRMLERLLGPRIAQKIFLGYVLPLAFLLAFGIILPIFLWFYLGRTIRELDDYTWLADHAVSLRRTAVDSEVHADDFIRYNDSQFEAEFIDARDAYHGRFREIEAFVTNLEDPELEIAVERVSDSFETWMKLAVSIPYKAALRDPQNRPAKSVLDSQRRAIQSQFGPVLAHIDALADLVGRERVEQEKRARAAEMMRQFTSIVIPLVALILSLLVGRSVALSITRPLDLLTYATREIELASGPLRVILEDFGDAGAGADDEFGDLQRSFRQMARTIAQREAVLHAQNEAVGALNRRIEAVLNATNDGILMLDRTGGFSVVNRRLADLFGMELDSLLDHTFNQAGPLLLSRFKNRTAIRRRFQELIDDSEAIADETYDLAEPPGRTVRIYSAPVRGRRQFYQAIETGNDPSENPDLLGRIFVFRDVTRETMLDRMKTEFVSTVSHELRTPLTAIKGYVDLMVSGQTGPLNPVQAEFMTMVQESTRRLTDLIVAMLDITRIESGRLELQQDAVAYVPLIQQTVRMMQQEADAKGVELLIDAPAGPETDFPVVCGDADRITQVLTNFLSNGIKYTPSGGRVTIHVEYETDFVTTCVEDTGIGIDTEDQRRLFQKFFRADNSMTREVGGTGLGLAITKTILEKLNGSVWVESTLGAGSRFYFTLPCVDLNDDGIADIASAGDEEAAADADEHFAPAQETLMPPPSATLVLPITSDMPTLHRLGHELRRLGFVTSGASTRAEAIRRTRDLRPDWALLDPLSPGLDTRSLLRELCALDSERSPCVLLGTLQMQSSSAAVFRDDLAALSLHSAASGGFVDLLQTAVRVLEARRNSEAGSHAPLTVLGIGSTTLREYLEPALRSVAGAHGHLSLVESPAQLSAYLHATSGGAQSIPDVIVLGNRFGGEEDAESDLGTWLARLRRRRQESWIACILLIEDDIFDSLSIRTVVPLGAGSLPIERLIEVLPQHSVAILTANGSMPPADEGGIGANEIRREDSRRAENAEV